MELLEVAVPRGDDGNLVGVQEVAEVVAHNGVEGVDEDPNHHAAVERVHGGVAVDATDDQSHVVGVLHGIWADEDLLDGLDDHLDDLDLAVAEVFALLAGGGIDFVVLGHLALDGGRSDLLG